MADDNRGNFGNPEEHAKAGSMSSGNLQQHKEAGEKGGQASQPNQSDNTHELTQNERSLGGQNSSRSDDSDEL